jgi:hypothetical protein
MSRYLCNLIKKVLEISTFKKQFGENREEFFKSRRLFVTFRSPVDAMVFKTLYNSTHQFHFSNLFRSMPSDLKKLDSDFKLNTKEDNVDDLMNEFNKLYDENELKNRSISPDRMTSLRQSTLEISTLNDFEIIFRKQGEMVSKLYSGPLGENHFIKKNFGRRPDS